MQGDSGRRDSGWIERARLLLENGEENRNGEEKKRSSPLSSPASDPVKTRLYRGFGGMVKRFTNRNRDRNNKYKAGGSQ